MYSNNEKVVKILLEYKRVPLYITASNLLLDKEVINNINEILKLMPSFKQQLQEKLKQYDLDLDSLLRELKAGLTVAKKGGTSHLNYLTTALKLVEYSERPDEIAGSNKQIVIDNQNALPELPPDPPELPSLDA